MTKRKSWSDMKNIPMTVTRYEKRGNRWEVVQRRRGLVSEQMHQNGTSPDTLRFFRGIGGYERNDNAYTARGYLPVRNVSINPSRDVKIVREYDLNNMRIRDAQYRRRYGLTK